MASPTIQEVIKSLTNRTPYERAGPPIAGVVLAGGRSRRFNGLDKATQIFAGKRLIERIIDRAKPQVGDLVISTNGDPSRFSDLDVEAIVIDDMEGHQGPLAGLAAAMSWLGIHRPKIRWVATFPVDCPFFPEQLVASLGAHALQKGTPAVPVSSGQMHPVFGLWPVHMEPALRRYFVKGRRRPLTDFIRSLDAIEVAFAPRSPDPFYNINTPADLSIAENIDRAFERGIQGQFQS